MSDHRNGQNRSSDGPITARSIARRSPSTGADDSLARIAAVLEAQRVELFACVDSQMALVDQWAALGQPAHLHARGQHHVPNGWFPWSLGNIRPTDYLFVRNAGPLPSEPTVDRGAHSGRAGATSLGDLGYGSALYLPIASYPVTSAGLCAYWVSERESWPSERGSLAVEWAVDSLSRTL